MRSRAIARMIAVLLVSGLATACSSAGKTLIVINSPESLPAGKTLSLTVRSLDGDPSGHVDRLYDVLAAKLVAEGIFQDVVKPPADSDYAMDATITATRDATGARIAFGFFAPRNYIAVEVKLRERASDRLLESFTSTGYGARNWMSPQGYGMDDPLREIADLVAVALQ